MGLPAFKLPFASPASTGVQKRKFSQYVPLTGTERTFGEDDIIVSKTDLKGNLTYVNKVFLDIASMSESQCLGAAHSVIRHPDMPRCIFKLLWDGLQDGREVFAYVVNMASNGDHYWVFAHVTPSFNANGDIIGYHSNRRVPDARIMPAIKELYGKLLAEEKRHPDRKQGLKASTDMLNDMLQTKGMGYDEFIFSL